MAANEKLNYACGMNASTARKLSKFIFQEFFYSLEVNLKERRFDILVYEKIENEEGEEYFENRFGKDYIKYFQEYWGEVPGFKLVYYKGIVTEILN